MQLATGSDSSLEDRWLKEITDLELSGQSAAERADRYLAQGQLEVAAELLREVVRDHPELPRARSNLAIVLWQLGRIVESQHELNRLVELFPNEPTAFLTWGKLLANAGRLKESEHRLKQALDRKSDAWEACSMLGDIAERQGNVEGAITWYQLAIHAAPQSGVTYLRLASAYHQIGSRDSAEKSLEIAEKLEPLDIAFRAEIARLKQTIGVDTNP